MYRLSWTTWLVAGLSAFTHGAENDTFGVLEADLVFPRNGDTYPPMENIPVIFAFQNFTESSGLSDAFRPRLQYSIWDRNNVSNKMEKSEIDFYGYVVTTPWPNKLWYQYHELLRLETTWQMNWTMRWQTCDGKGRGLENVTSTQSIMFSTNSSANALDLVAATKNETTCTNVDGMGIAWNVAAMHGEKGESDRCAEMASPQPMPTPCKIAIQPAEASYIAGRAPGSSVSKPPDDKSGAKTVVASRAAYLLALFASLIHILR